MEKSVIKIGRKWAVLVQDENSNQVYLQGSSWRHSPVYGTRAVAAAVAEEDADLYSTKTAALAAAS